MIRSACALDMILGRCHLLPLSFLSIHPSQPLCKIAAFLYIYKMLTVAIIIGIAILWAAMDTMAHHYGVSIFKDKNPQFWDARISASKPTKRILGYWVDAWHLAKSLLLFGVIALATMAIETHWPWYIEFTGLGLIYILIFNTFYNIILKRK